MPASGTAAEPVVQTVAIVGGTGKLGSAIARRLGRAGLKIVIGSRIAEAAASVAAELGYGITGLANAEAAAAGDIVIVAVPFAAQEATLADIAPHVAGKIVVDTTVPLMPPKVMRVQLPAEGSAALRAQRLLGGQAIVTSAFHNVAADKLAGDGEVDCDVLVFGDERAARDVVVELVAQAGLRAIHGGALANSAAAEALTSVLIFINKTYRADGAGLRISGLPLDPDDRSAPAP